MPLKLRQGDELQCSRFWSSEHGEPQPNRKLTPNWVKSTPALPKWGEMGSGWGIRDIYIQHQAFVPLPFCDTTYL